jgi:hypothetical protein
MNVLQLAEDHVRQYPALRYQRRALSLLVDPPNPNGFPVTLEVTRDGFVVRLAGWHEEFEEEREALDCFRFAFSPQCRLRVASRNGVDCEWTLQVRDEDGWQTDTTVEKKKFHLWKAKEVRYLHNILA